MNKKGQLTVGLFIMATITIIVGLILLTASAGQIGTTTTIGFDNGTVVTMPTVGETVTIATGIKAVSSLTVINVSNGITMNDGNYTVLNNRVVDGNLVALLQNDDGHHNGSSVNLSYSATPDTYIDSSGGRSIAGIIIIFFALAIFVVALVPTLRAGADFR